MFIGRQVSARISIVHEKALSLVKGSAFFLWDFIISLEGIDLKYGD